MEMTDLKAAIGHYTEAVETSILDLKDRLGLLERKLNMDYRAETKSLDLVIAELRAERVRQGQKWGGSEHDDQHGTNDFLALIHDKKDKAFKAWINCEDEDLRRRLVQIGALAVAAVESIDRQQANKPRSDDNANR